MLQQKRGAPSPFCIVLLLAFYVVCYRYFEVLLKKLRLSLEILFKQ